MTGVHWLLGGYDWSSLAPKRGYWLLGGVTGSYIGGYDWSSLASRRGYWLLGGYDWGSLAPI